MTLEEHNNQYKLIRATNLWLAQETDKTISSPLTRSSRKKLEELRVRHRQLIKDTDRLIDNC